MFEEELGDIKDQLDANLDSTVRDVENKLELLIEMLWNWVESLE